MSNCCHCLKVCNPPYLACNSCNRPLHGKCLDLTESELRIFTSSKSTHLKLFCNQCKITLNSLQQMKALISDLQSTMEKRLEKIESLIGPTVLEPVHKEELIQESVERALRAPNVILYNVPEDNEITDAILANDILECIDPSAIVSPDGVSRLGKPTQNKVRPLKLCFNRVETARLVLTKRSALKNSKFSNVYVNSDKTKLQQEYFRNIQLELKTRRENGENNIKIKFLNNVPRIVPVTNNSLSRSSLN